jgi:hypothetical protein
VVGIPVPTTRGMLGTRKSAVLVALIALAVPARAAADVAPTPEAPVVVAGAPVTLDEAKARTGRDPVPSPGDVAEQLASLVHARWVAGEAARRGITASATRVAALVALEQRSAGGAERWRQVLAVRGISEAEARAQIEERVLREALVDAITAGARGDTQRWGLAMDDFNRRWRALTVCAAGLRGPVRVSCVNVAQSKERCVWYAIGEGGLFGLGDLCHAPREWSVDVDLVEQFYPRSDPAELACVPHGDDALDRLKRYLRRTAPSVLRAVFFDGDCDPQFMSAPYRSAVVTTLHAIARIAAHERRT